MEIHMGSLKSYRDNCKYMYMNRTLYNQNIYLINTLLKVPYKTKHRSKPNDFWSSKVVRFRQFSLYELKIYM